MKNKIYIKGLLSGGGLAAVITLAGLFLMSLWVGLVDDPVFYLANKLFFLAFLSLALGGFKAGYSAGNLGWLHGAITGLFYTGVFLFLPRVLVGDFAWTPFLKEFFFYVSLAAFAGAAGVNYLAYTLKRKKVRRYY